MRGRKLSSRIGTMARHDRTGLRQAHSIGAVTLVARARRGCRRSDRRTNPVPTSHIQESTREARGNVPVGAATVASFPAPT